MARNNLTLGEHLFESLEWLGDRDVKGEDLKEEIRRAEAKCKVAQQITAHADLILKAAKAAAAGGFSDKKIRLPKMLTEL